MKKIVFACLAALSLAVVACGDDKEGARPSNSNPPATILGQENSVESCSDGKDNDGDGKPDCADEDCAAFCTTPENTEEACKDEKDNDGDGLTDCDDEDCAAFCTVTPEPCTADEACAALDASKPLCVAGACVARCTAETDCGEANSCNTESGKCERDPLKVLFVTIPGKGFAIAQTETTTAQFKTCVDASECTAENYIVWEDGSSCNYARTNYEQHPMNCVNQAGAAEFCESIGGRLPTKAEWETAAWAG